VLYVHEWGDLASPPVVCLHGVTGHGERFKRLAEERWTDFRVVAPDLRGHGRSDWEPPWTIPAQLADLAETARGLGIERADWVGHSYGGRLVLELAAAQPKLVRRAVLLDPAIQVLPDIAELIAHTEVEEPVWESVEAWVASREDAGFIDVDRAVRDVAMQVETLPDGRVRRTTDQRAVVSVYRELASDPPPPEVMTMPTLLVYAPAYGLVRDEHLVYGDTVVPLPGMHMLMWGAFDETADAVERFLGG